METEEVEEEDEAIEEDSRRVEEEPSYGLTGNIDSNLEDDIEGMEEV